MEKYNTKNKNKNKNIINRKCKLCCDKFINCIIGIFSYNKGSGKMLKDNKEIEAVYIVDIKEIEVDKIEVDNKEIEVEDIVDNKEIEVDKIEIDIKEIEVEDIVDNKEWVMA